ncbi:hypothetical protein ACRYWZ_26815, partial [Agrobacterium deltaense]|uniref:hypothetical protein n=1 Tax=Agrobacterium deltaense TaxID=1183412 RepID=UPI003D968970
MYSTRKTETVLTVLATCAGRAGCSLALWEISQAGSVGAEEIKRSVSLLLRHGLLERGLDGRVTLTIDPGAVTLGTILHLTQPNLARQIRGRFCACVVLEDFGQKNSCGVARSCLISFVN